MRISSKLPRRPGPLAGAIAAAVVLGACLSAEDIDLGRDVDAAARAQPGAIATGDAGDGASIMSAAIDATEGAICAGQCIDIIATASGGVPPYTFSWGEDLGEGPGPKTVCPIATTTYSVLVGSSDYEQSAASAVIAVVDCDAGATPAPDAGQGSTARTDSGTPASQAQSLCVSNPSFEGTPTTTGMTGMTGTTGTTGAGGPPGTVPADVPPDWQACLGAPDDDPSVSLLPAQNGKSYVGLSVGSGSFLDLTASVGTTLCAPLQPGQTYSFCLYVGVGVRGVMPPSGGPSPVLELWGGGSSCAQEDLLWTSPSITNDDSWTQVCGSFVPSQEIQDLVLLPQLAASVGGTGSWSYVIVDDITAGP